MPVNRPEVLARDDRFTDQRWLLDLAIQSVGPGWGPRPAGIFQRTVRPGAASAPFMALRATIGKFDDFSPEFIKVARFFERRGSSLAEQGHDVSAREDFFAAAIAYGAAQWPIYADSEVNDALEKKTACYLGFAQRADHHIEAVEIPFGDQTVPGHLHLPPGTAAGTEGGLPCVVMVSGMTPSRS